VASIDDWRWRAGVATGWKRALLPWPRWIFNAVEIRSEPQFRQGVPQKLFRVADIDTDPDPFNVSSDRIRSLVEVVNTAAASSITVIRMGKHG
jgi:hypothetical protein